MAIAENTTSLLTLIVILLGIRIAVESLTLPPAVTLAVGKGITFFVAVVLTWLVACLYDAMHKTVFEPYAKKPGSTIDAIAKWSPKEKDAIGSEYKIVPTQKIQSTR